VCHVDPFLLCSTCGGGGGGGGGQLERLTCAPKPIQNAVEHGQNIRNAVKVEKVLAIWSECIKLVSEWMSACFLDKQMYATETESGVCEVVCTSSNCLDSCNSYAICRWRKDFMEEDGWY